MKHLRKYYNLSQILEDKVSLEELTQINIYLK